MSRPRTRKSIAASCDSLWSRIVRQNGVCERCGEGAREAHHIYGRTNRRLRWDPRNGVSLCFQCHRWAGRYPVEQTRWLDGNRTEDMAYLRNKFQEGPINRTLADYLALERELKAMLEAVPA